jgi:hypothetical protein
MNALSLQPSTGKRNINSIYKSLLALMALDLEMPMSSTRIKSITSSRSKRRLLIVWRKSRNWKNWIFSYPLTSPGNQLRSHEKWTIEAFLRFIQGCMRTRVKNRKDWRSWGRVSMERRGRQKGQVFCLQSKGQEGCIEGLEVFRRFLIVTEACFKVWGRNSTRTLFRDKLSRIMLREDQIKGTNRIPSPVRTLKQQFILNSSRTMKTPLKY